MIASGQTAPDSTIELWIEPAKTGVTAKDILKQQGAVTSNGKWSLSVDTKDLTKGTYNVRARTMIKVVGYSDFSQVVSVGVGESVSAGVCAGADLNKDGKVNLVDFSILLYYWGSSNGCADQNHDGKVNLTDFSIMLYNWTG